MVSGKKALADAGLPWDGPELRDIDRSRCGILIGAPARPAGPPPAARI